MAIATLSIITFAQEIVIAHTKFSYFDAPDKIATLVATINSSLGTCMIGAYVYDFSRNSAGM